MSSAASRPLIHPFFTRRSKIFERRDKERKTMDPISVILVVLLFLIILAIVYRVASETGREKGWEEAYKFYVHRQEEEKQKHSS
jgi:hypothetical protein